MWNLKLLCADQTDAVKADHFCFDIDQNVYFGSSDGVYCFDPTSKLVKLCAELDKDDKTSEKHIIGMDYLDEFHSIFLASSSGDLYMYSIFDNEISCVGMVETRVEGYAWSPDQDFLVLLTGANTLIFMTKEFDPVSEQSLSPEEFGEKAPIDVGWGSKTTQFHGSEGKGAAVVKKKDSVPALPYDDGLPRISWKEDGEYFATSSIDPNKGFRQLRIWNRKAILQFTGETVAGLEEPISWRPFGNAIACSQQSPNKHKIVFFEKNGLLCGEFQLPFEPNTHKVIALEYNPDSKILLVVAEKLTDSPSEFHVMLWTTSNYVWYLKQSFQLKKSPPFRSLMVKWSSTDHYKLHCYSQASGDLYNFKVTLTITQSLFESGTVTCIDEKNICISPFSNIVIPPPMYGYSFSVSAPVQTVFFSPYSPDFGAYIGNFKVLHFTKDMPINDLNGLVSNVVTLNPSALSHEQLVSRNEVYKLGGIIELESDSFSCSEFQLNHWTWASKHRLLFVCHSRENNHVPKFSIMFVDIPVSSAGSNSVSPRLIVDLDCSVVGICTNKAGSVAAVQLSNGKVLHLKIGENQDSAGHATSNHLTPWYCDSNYKELVLPQPCATMSILSISGKDYFLGLSNKLNLFCDDFTVLSKCTSYFIHDEFLLATTADNSLKCFSFSQDFPDSLKNKSELPTNVQSQMIEKGARIVIAPSYDTKVILQMPRGNLETIHPRSLILSAMCKHLDNLEFGKAFKLSKVHRIDINLLYDYNPEKFLKYIGKVVEQVGRPSDLNLILAGLKNEDVRFALYPLTFGSEPENSKVAEDKINRVCDAFRNVLLSNDDKKYYHTLLGTYAKKNPPELDKALLLLKALKESSTEKSVQSLVDSSLNFLLYLVDVNYLMDVALGTYDLETTIMVAQKSQKDPKEFLPLYNDLQKLEENYRKYKIDMHLRRFKKALQHVAKCDDKFEECVSLIKDQRLYTESLDLFPIASDRYKVVWKEYGTYLMEKRHFDEAGLVFTRCGDLENALAAHKECLDWQSALCSASHLNYSDDRIIFLCQEMAIKLKSEARNFKTASYLLEHYVKDIEESIVTLIEGHEWKSAELLMAKYRRQDITETHLKPALKEHHQMLQTQLTQMLKQFTTHFDRLKFLRTQKKIETQQPSTHQYAEDDLFSDTGSIASDVASSVAESKQMSGSIVTRKSSKSRRKQKFKKYRLKEGSADEDLALMVALSDIVVSIDVVKDNFLPTLIALVHFEYDALAKELHQLMGSVVTTIEPALPIIWCAAESSQIPTESAYGPNSTVNSITAHFEKEKGAHQQVCYDPKDPALAMPPWRKMELTLQMFK